MGDEKISVHNGLFADRSLRGSATNPQFTELVNRRSWAVRRAAVSRSLLPLGYRYGRPRHDLTHRQDPEADAAKHVLVEL